MTISPYVIPAILVRSNTIQELEVVRVVCEHYGVTKDEISVRCRKREIVEPRQMVMTFMHLLCRKGTARTAAMFNQNHATCTHAVNTISNLYLTDSTIRRDVEDILDLLGVNAFKKKEFIKKLIERERRLV